MATKFLFDNNLNLLPEDEKKFSEKELKEAETKAYQEGQQKGLEDGKIQAVEAMEQKTLLTVQQIEQNLVEAFNKSHFYHQEIMREQILLTMSILKKIIPHFLEVAKEQEIERFIETTFQEMSSKSQIKIQLHSENFEQVKKSFLSQVKDQKISENIDFVENDDISANQCLIDWEHGGAEWNTEELMQNIEKMVMKHLPHLTLIDAPESIEEGSSEEEEKQQQDNIDYEKEGESE